MYKILRRGENFMGKINSIAKWDLSLNQWIIPSNEQVGRSFAFSHYDRIINNPNNELNYIIIANGSRVEDHSKNFTHIDNKKLRIDKMIEHYKNNNENYDIQVFLMDADAPIIEDAKLFAQYVDSISCLPTTKSINVISISKCGAMCFYVPRFFKRNESYKKLNLYNIATPYNGTKFASPTILYQEIKAFILKLLGDTPISHTIYSKLIKIYESISSNSHMDYDVAIPGGIDDDFTDLYDKSFIQNIFSSDNLHAIKKIHLFKNFTTKIDDSTLLEALSTFNLNGIGLCILNDIFFKKQSDGFVTLESQKKVDDYLGITSTHLISSHHDINSNPRIFKTILKEVDNNIRK